MLKTYKFRMYQTKKQIVKLNMHFGHTRFVYNYFLNYSKVQYENGNKTNYHDWAKALTQLKRTEDHSWLKDVNSQTLQQSLMDLQNAFKNFFSHEKIDDLEAKKILNSLSSWEKEHRDMLYTLYKQRSDEYWDEMEFTPLFWLELN